MNEMVTELKRRLARLSRRRGGVALGLWGEAGSGKTWAAREVRRQLPLRSVEVGALWTAEALLAALPAPARPPAWLERALTRLAQGGLDHEAGADALAALLGALAPFVLHVEDLHEAPGPVLAFWEALAARVARSDGVGLLLTSRRPPPEGLGALRTVPLDPGATRTLLDDALGAALPAAAAVWIHDRTRGHPLFSLEFLRFLVRQGQLWNDGQRWHWRPPPASRLPSGVEALIAHQLRAAPLSDAARRAWDALALWPPWAPPERWAGLGSQLAGVSPACWPGVLEELRRADLLRGGDVAHPLYREVAAAHSTPLQRQQVAARALEVLEDHDPLLAAAFVRGAGLPGPRALALLRRGAQVARQQGLARQEAECLSGALEHAHGEERADLALQAARLWRTIDPLRVEPLAAEVLGAVPDHLEATFLLAGTLVAQGQHERAERLVAALGENPGQAWFAHRLTLHAEQHQYPAVLQLWQAWPERHSGAPPLVTAAVGRALEFAGQPREALRLLDEGLARQGLGVEERSALLMARCRVHYNAGELPAAEADATAVIELADPVIQRPDLARALSSRATIRDTLGRYAEALADAERSLALFGELGVARDHAQQQTRLACLLIEYGEYERAESLLHEGRGVLLRAGATHFLALCEMNLAYLYLEQQPPFGGALALQYAHLGVLHARQTGSPLILAQALGTAARAEALHGTAPQALALAREAQVLTAPPAPGAPATHDSAWSEWALGFALEAAGDPAGALQQFRAAGQQLGALGLELWAARLGLEADRLAGDREAARGRLALFLAQELHSWAGVTRRYFPELAPDAQAGLPPPADRRRGRGTAGAADPAPASPGTAGARLRLRVLGPLQVWRDGRRLPFRAPLGRTLLAALVDARLGGQPGVSPLELQQTLYPHLPDEQAAAALHQLIYRTRQALGPELVVLTDQGYALGPVDTDAEAFLHGGNTALWAGTYLADSGPGGSGPVADRLYARLRAELGTLAAQPAPDALLEAARVGALLLQDDPYDAELLRQTLHALNASGQMRAARALLAGLRERYAEVGETLPGWATGAPDLPRTSPGRP